MRYFLRFAVFYALLYVGVLVLKALADPVGYYSSFFDHYADLVGGMSRLLLALSKAVVSLAGYDSHFEPGGILRLSSGNGIQLYFECMGFKVLCFWAAFVLANGGRAKTTILWLGAGLVGICLVNAVRLGLLLMAMDGRWERVLHLDHHDWFNIGAYSLVLLLIFFYDRSHGKILKNKYN